MRKPPIQAPGDRRARRPPAPARRGAPTLTRPPLGHRGRDAEPLGDVVDHEAHDQEGAERELARRANDEPIARPSPRLCRPMPIGDHRRQGEARRAAPAAARRRAARARSGGRPRTGRGSWPRRPGSTSPGPPSAPGSARLQLEGLGEGVDRQEGQQAAREGHEGRQPARVGAAQRGQPEHPERRPGPPPPGGRSGRSRRTLRRSPPGSRRRRAPAVVGLDARRAGDARSGTGRPRPSRTGSRSWSSAGGRGWRGRRS